KYLPWFQIEGPYVTREVTVRDLLTHRTGLPRGDQLWYASGFSRLEVLHRVRFLQPQWSFRSHYGYQNIMFMAAGEVLHAASGATWDDFVRSHILTPLGMTRTRTGITALDTMTDVATPHMEIDDTVRVIPWRNMDNLGPAGAMISSAHDLAQWLLLQLGDGVYHGTRLLSDSVVEEMHTPQTVIRMSKETHALYPDTHFMAYGLAWSLKDYHGKLFVGHGGVIDGMRTEIGMIPEDHLGVVVLANLDGTNFPVAILHRVLDAYMGAPPRDWNTVLLAEARKSRAREDSTRKAFEAARVPGTHPSLPLEQYAGTYSDSLYGDIRITDENGKLVARMGPSYTGDLEHWHYNTFKVAWRDRGLGTAFFTFALNAEGRVVSLQVLHLGGFERLASPNKVAAGSP
ncbi:MAG TPA: serine hydrolase, partial [Gemmatimonadaceae bacterium]|nr:serine hydrolase [Gemmatimonadaceae bacterium]